MLKTARGRNRALHFYPASLPIVRIQRSL